MYSYALLLSGTLALAGAVVFLRAVAVAVAGARRTSTSLDDYLDAIEPGASPSTAVTDELQGRLRQPFHVRMARSLGGGVLAKVVGLTPRSYVRGVERKLVLAGRSETVKVGEVLVGQAALAGALLLAGGAYAVLADPPTRVAVLAVVVLPAVGFLLPWARLNRAVTERQQAIVVDLPDTLDLLAISVEAGMGFEGALDVVCRNFDSALAEEFALTLREIEFGLPRREALQNLKERTDTPDLASFVLALVQADALGIPIGRVLKTQAVEMRSKRRMWAREKAGKLPVKILFPLVLFIFPPILVILMGPATVSVRNALS